MNFDLNVDVCSYTDLTYDKLYLKSVDNYNYNNNSNINYISIKKNKKELLFVLTPWTKKITNYSGIVDKTFDKQLIEYPTEFRIDLNDDDDAQLEFINRLKDLDTYFMSPEFKNKYLPKNYKGKFWPLYNEQHKWVKAKIQYITDGDGKKKMSTNIYNVFSYPNNPSKFYKKEASDVDTALKLKYKIQKNKNVRFVLLPTSIWYNKMMYGIKLKIFEVHVGTNKPEFNYSENN